VIRKHFNFYR